MLVMLKARDLKLTRLGDFTLGGLHHKISNWLAQNPEANILNITASSNVKTTGWDCLICYSES
jgi:hypothetical protein